MAALVRRRCVGFLIAALLIAAPSAFAASPAPVGYVNDFAAIVDEPAETYLQSFLNTLERDTSAEVVVVTVKSLEGMTIEEYANRIFNEWGIGKKQHDNGVLLLVAQDNRSVRIEVGYGLEHLIPDGLAGDIIRTEMIPEFRTNNFPRGIGRGLDRIARILRRDPAAVISPESSDSPAAWMMVPFMSLFVGLGAFAAGLGLRTRTFGPLLWGGMFAVIPLVILAGSVSAVWAAILAALGLAPLALGVSRGRSAYWTTALRSPTAGSARNQGPLDWEMGGSSSSSSGGSAGDGGSSSGESFGGGSSGGGGASGRW
jgi:uncharacterized protein